ncbi:glutaminyl-peptide cyclotransferase [Arcticibacter tournemirensis]|uniref:Glutaminyl-peptide cyclotransferase n=1 Tax=Arcticibacter tournemirensis TaxID=699437 RepID=A0A4Q0M416_9SPHI|nr:glutaminyl-peptide cyclotransferase [Arcticibacter tournemirensis]RXF67615.1 glutaminyl-peptide cyclotransferase [Arcticibacter tournemirensis]
MKRVIIVLFISVLFIAACKTQKSSSVYFLSPEEGRSVPRGQNVTLKIDAESGSFDSIAYLLDTVFITSRKDTSSVSVQTSDLSLGIKVLTAKVYEGAEYKEVTTNIVLLPTEVPVQYKYEVVNTFPHDTSAFTQGLEYHDGIFYESDGMQGESSLRKVDPESGKVLKKIDMPETIFAEGLTIVGDKLIQLTWQNQIGIVYNKDTFEKLREFPYQASQQGWGLCYDGKNIYKSDGTNRIYTLNKDTYLEEGYIEVYSNKGAIDSLNELEYINGRIYANVWERNTIVIINPSTGVVEGELDLSDLYPIEKRNPTADVLNGIAWDAVGKRLFVTGKRWDKVFELRVAGPKL